MKWDELLHCQHGVVSRQQALTHGVTDSALVARVRSGRWQRLHVGVYATFSGEPHRLTWLWAAILRVGDGAVLSHETAAELDGLTDRVSDVIHVAVPRNRRVTRTEGIRLHRSSRVESARHPARLPPRTRVEETVLDLVTASRGLDQAYGWFAKACERRLTTAQRLERAIEGRPLMRWRKELAAALGDIRSGVHSLLELRYLHGVERAHGLPAGLRQRHVNRRGRSHYDDVRYEPYRTIVELDGRIGHVEEGRWRDMWRDNVSTTGGDATLRYGLADVTERPCRVAAQVAGVLLARGWPGTPRHCGPGCGLVEDIPRRGVENPPHERWKELSAR